jgi:chlorite dismutase
MAERILSLYVTYAYTDAHWALHEDERRIVRRHIAEAVPKVSPAGYIYQAFPTRVDSDFLLWTSWEADAPEAPDRVFGAYHHEIGLLRQYIRPVQVLWGFTQPSMYSRGKSEQDMDPFAAATRTRYLVIYPFSKTKDWYLMSMDARQGQMNEHIKIGKQYFDVKQLLLYSFGLQDQEFVVSYETEELPRFSELVKLLRSTEARRHTELDTPIITGLRRSAEEFIG